MNLFQVLGVTLAGAFVLLLVVALFRRNLRPLPALAWIAVWLMAGVSIARPGLTVAVAQALGIARGADLVAYLAILAGIVAFLLMYLKMRRTDMILTTLVREIALLEAKIDRSSGEGSRGGG